MTLLYEGKAKRIFSTNNNHELRVEYKDDVTAGNGAKKDTMVGKGRLNNQITSIIFKHLQEKGVESHFIKRLSDTEQLVESVKIIPLEVVVRNIASGSITKRLGLENGQIFKEPLVEFFYKNDDLNDPLITEDHIKLLNIANDEDIKILKMKALAINEVLKQFMEEMNLKLVDFKIEFGKTETGKILLADEISPDTCRIWDKDTNVNFDKDVYRNNTGSLIETYQLFLNKLEDLK
ncbi:phosphoribosylaminoimidazolesuccinocarboxamide synthase [Staphylococcus schweitzeri]|uniref:Phosphoribosylaminoimidazole-succinocarboxamide synthase n=1 Tax=Staphylococcus schweitzeri TaxID=1654388 RepID=A0A2K4AL90_9STAP|nr:phosphoribosylaminoimidazolesuccinocarboxamide synthase [Staphylococcus schweitzeri]MBE2128740.1 phosphoribosylaminoimidazolesuccinocarboxamide synthase [Staphylococcus schweitzeri]PNZ50767.1 phosphoribosylaminoimidazolesuccinocarboxamide synthase [Staphylococcus schweitzeri]CDR28188.1 putative phosphoribosylaminoimidazole-succinocarboxamide synthase [Staphylococcus schweitzeri]CDR54551.1 putative phosphoribosylaminoimidazole-succinocarboxamide synthase [Staphylococcus schweitzeri]CDR61140.